MRSDETHGMTPGLTRELKRLRSEFESYVVENVQKSKADVVDYGFRNQSGSHYLSKLSKSSLDYERNATSAKREREREDKKRASESSGSLKPIPPLLVPLTNSPISCIFTCNLVFVFDLFLPVSQPYSSARRQIVFVGLLIVFGLILTYRARNLWLNQFVTTLFWSVLAANS